MSILIRLLSLPFLASLTGVAALLTLLWFIGPLLAIAGYSPLLSPRNRLIAMAVVLALWLLYYLVTFLLARRKNKKMAAAMAQSEIDPVAAQTEEELLNLNKIFDEALTHLKRAKFDKKQGSYLYQLPWYVMIGPPGSGKTTALLNSGLSFPLEKKLGRKEIKGVGGTRDCDWLFTNQAVLIDTAGRYTTQDSHQEVDSSAWQGFLQLLKKHRRRRPINGVIVAIGMAELLQLPESDRLDHAQAIRKRIQELHEKLEVRFPVYVLFTKVDLLAGCIEFFDDLDKSARAQVWGMTFPVDDLRRDTDPIVECFDSEFELLEQQLNQHLLKRLQDERDPQRRDRIYTFPQQFSAIKYNLKSFLDEIFLPNRFEDRSLLRGVYFTSGTQEGNPIDRMMGILATTFGITRQNLPSFSGVGKSFFLTRLFQNVIFEESGLAGTNPRLERRRLLIQSTAYAAILALTTFSGLAWFTSYARNQSYVDSVEQQYASLHTDLSAHNAAVAEQTPDYEHPKTALPALNSARDIPGATGTRPEAPWTLRLGLYQGHKLGASAETAYQRILNRALLPRLMAQLEQRLATVEGPDRELRDALQAYLSLDTVSSQDRPDTEDARAEELSQRDIAQWFQNTWQKDHNLPAIQREQLQTHLNALLSHWPLALPRALNHELIAVVREYLPKDFSAAQLYRQLKTEDYGQGFKLSDVHPQLPLIFTRLSGVGFTEGINGLYTQPGQIIYQDYSKRYIQQLAKGDWVLNLPATESTKTDHLWGELQALYWDDYCPQWTALVEDLALFAPGDLSDSVSKLELLSGAGSPLREFLLRIAKEIQDIPGCLAQITQLVSGQSQPSLDELAKELEEIAFQLNAFASLKKRGETINVSSARDLIDRLEQIPKTVPQPLNRWLQELADSIPIFLTGGLREAINNAWQRKVLTFCERALHGRYPFSPRAQEEVTLDDFARFFGPNGILNEFINSGDNPLKNFVDTNADPWRWRDRRIGQSKRTKSLKLIQLATEISQSFFGTQPDRPSAKFTLRPLELSGGANRVVLNLDGQRVTYARSSAAAVELQWPSPNGSGYTKLQFFPGPFEVVADGTWGWFRMLQRSTIKKLANDKFRITLAGGAYVASFELKANSTFNPFYLKLRQFKCPKTL